FRVFGDQGQVALAAGKISVGRHQTNGIGRRWTPIATDVFGPPSRDWASRSDLNPHASQSSTNRVVRASESRRYGDDGLRFVELKPLEQSRVDRCAGRAHVFNRVRRQTAPVNAPLFIHVYAERRQAKR